MILKKCHKPVDVEGALLLGFGLMCESLKQTLILLHSFICFQGSHPHRARLDDQKAFDLRV
jgi:hypothetical protein